MGDTESKLGYIPNINSSDTDSDSNDDVLQVIINFVNLIYGDDSNDTVCLKFGDFGSVEKQNIRNFSQCSNEVNFQHVPVKKTSKQPSSAYKIKARKSSYKNRDLSIKYMKPHVKTVPYKKRKNLIGTVVYERGGQPVAKHTGVFGFQKPRKHANACKASTQHARCYKALYGRCPEEEDGLVAIGFSNHKEEGLRFNSSTLNDKDQPYLNTNYYKEGKNRQAGKVEQRVIKKAIRAWEKAGCPTTDWKFRTRRVLDK